MNALQTANPGHELLDSLMGPAAWLTMPRSLIRNMPDAWQAKLAELVLEYVRHFPNQPGDIGTLVFVVKDGEVMQPAPRWLVDWQNPDEVALATLRLPKGTTDVVGQEHVAAH